MRAAARRPARRSGDRQAALASAKLLQSLPAFLGRCSANQRVPVVRRIPAFQHAGEDRVRVIAPAIRAKRAGIVHPRVHDDSLPVAEPEKKPVPAVAGFGSPPV